MSATHGSKLALPAGQPLVDVERSGVVESVHLGHVVVLDAEGEVLMSIGSPDAPMFPRSANKPLQAVGMLRSGLRLQPRQLALSAASHSGERQHVDVARAILADAGLTEAQLQCPPDLPLGEAARLDWLSRGGRADRIHMNCSGKHSAMLSLCVARGWSGNDYLDPAHPLQQAVREAVEDLTASHVVATGVDGCGAPLLAGTLAGLARAFHRLVQAQDGPERLIADALRAHPDLVGGTARPVTRLMRGVPGLLAKDGAEGVWAAALPDVGAVAVKITDGAMRAADRVLVAALRRLHTAGEVLDELAEEPLLGGARVVGSVHVRADILAEFDGAVRALRQT